METSAPATAKSKEVRVTQYLRAGMLTGLGSLFLSVLPFLGILLAPLAWIEMIRELPADTLVIVGFINAVPSLIGSVIYLGIWLPGGALIGYGLYRLRAVGRGVVKPFGWTGVILILVIQLTIGLFLPLLTFLYLKIL